MFAALISLPMLGQLAGPTLTRSETEARTLAQRPGLPQSWPEWSTLPKRLEVFLADHFGFRAPLTAAYSLLRFAVSSPTSPDVVYGREGYLFYTAGGTLQQSMGVFLREELMTRMADFSAALYPQLLKHDIAFLVAPIPNGSTINRPYLPRWASATPGDSEYDMAMRMLAARGVPRLDLRPALLAERERRPVYQRTDTHWNLVGTLVAHNEIAIAIGHPEWSIDVGRAVKGYDLRPKGGDLARMLGVSEYESELLPRIDLTGYARADSPVVLVIGDSFSSIFPAIWVNGGSVVFLPVPPCMFDLAMIETYHPAIVVWAPAERTMICWGWTPRGDAHSGAQR